MVSAPISYIGLVIALLLIATILGGVWMLVNKMVFLPSKQLKTQRRLPDKTENVAEDPAKDKQIAG